MSAALHYFKGFKSKLGGRISVDFRISTGFHDIPCHFSGHPHPPDLGRSQGAELRCQAAGSPQFWGVQPDLGGGGPDLPGLHGGDGTLSHFGLVNCLVVVHAGGGRMVRLFFSSIEITR